MERVNQRPTQAWPGLGEQVDRLHHAGMGSRVEIVDPVADLVDEVDLLLLGRHLTEYSFR